MDVHANTIHTKLLKWQVKDLLVQLQNLYDGLKDKNEIAIIKKYSCNGKRYTTAFTSKIIFLNFYTCLHY